MADGRLSSFCHGVQRIWDTLVFAPYVERFVR